MAHEIEGRRGYFLVVNEDGFESDFLAPGNADKEASRLLFDARQKRHELRVVWCFWDEQGIGLKALPVYHDIGVVAVEDQESVPERQRAPKVLVAKCVWQQCEEYLLRMNCRPGAEANARVVRL